MADKGEKEVVTITLSSDEEEGPEKHNFRYSVPKIGVKVAEAELICLSEDEENSTTANGKAKDKVKQSKFNDDDDLDVADVIHSVVIDCGGTDEGGSAEEGPSSRVINRTLEQGQDDNGNAEDVKTDPKKLKLIQNRLKKLEKCLNDISTKIKELDEKEVDFNLNDEDFLENEDNSDYLVRERYVKKYIETFNLICVITKCSTHTGRPTQRKLINSLHQYTDSERLKRYPEIASAVKDFFNSQDFALFVPDFPEVLEIVKQENENLGNDISESDQQELAVRLHKEIVMEIQVRRVEDTMQAFPPSCHQDPADFDPELARKLEENKTKGKSEEDVVNKFTELAKNPLAAKTEESSNSEEDEDLVKAKPLCEQEEDTDKEDELEDDEGPNSNPSKRENSPEVTFMEPNFKRIKLD